MLRTKCFGTRGFTLVEVLVAMTVLGVGILGCIALQTSAIATRAHAQHLTTAKELTSAQLDELLLTDRSTLSDGARETPITMGGVSYTQDWVIVENSPAVGMKSIRLRTNWTEKDRVRSVELTAVVPQ